MEKKEHEETKYKRIPVSPTVKKRLDIAKATSDCNTFSEFIDELITDHEIITIPMELRFVLFPSFNIGMREENGRLWITSGSDNKTWIDITDILPKRGCC